MNDDSCLSLVAAINRTFEADHAAWVGFIPRNRSARVAEIHPVGSAATALGFGACIGTNLLESSLGLDGQFSSHVVLMSNKGSSRG
jgi:hypothetical protein